MLSEVDLCMTKRVAVMLCEACQMFLGPEIVGYIATRPPAQFIPYIYMNDRFPFIFLSGVWYKSVRLNPRDVATIALCYFGLECVDVGAEASLKTL